MSARKDIIAAAERVADNAVESVLDAIRDAIKDRRENAVWWYHFHDAMVRTLPRWRWLARRAHQAGRRRAAAAILANACLRGACPHVKGE